MHANSRKRIIIWLVIILATYLLSQLALSPPAFTATDFPSWRNDWYSLLCKLNRSSGCNELSKFPAAYLLNSIAVSLVSLEYGQWIVTGINFIFLCISIAIIYLTNKIYDVPRGAWAYIIALIFSVIPSFYLNTGALELQYGILLGIYSIAIYETIIKKIFCRRTSTMLGISAFLLPLYKDTSLLLMCISFFAAILSASQRFSPGGTWKILLESRRSIIIIMLALIPSLIILLYYNWYRYESIMPIPYLIEAQEASPPVGIKFKYLYWIFFSPNGGLVVSWSASLTLLLIWLRFIDRRISKYALLTMIGLILTMSLILANWWTPFGWEGWGNRLILPSAVASLIVIAATSIPLTSHAGLDRKTTNFKERFFDYSGLALTFAVFITSFAYIAIGYSTNRNNYSELSLWGSDACKVVGQLRVNRPIWEFKKSPVHIQCHYDRFSYIPGAKMDLLPISVVNRKKYSIHDENGAGVLGGGWSHIEPWGVWSNGNIAEIRFIPGQKINKISIELTPFLFGEHISQRVAIKMGDTQLVSDTLTSNRTIVIQLPDTIEFDPNSFIKLTLDLPDAISPVQLGLNADERLLGVGLLSIEFQ